MSAATAILKKNETTRVPFIVSLGNARLNLGEAGRSVKAKLVSAETVVTLALGSGLGLSNPGNGEAWFECTAANIVTLGSPAAVTVIIDVWGADNVLEISRSGTLGVTL